MNKLIETSSIMAVFIFCIHLATGSVQAGSTPPENQPKQPSAAANKSQRQHPYILFDSTDAPKIQARLRDRYIGARWAQVQQAALDPPDDFDTRGVHAAGLALLLTGDRKFARPAIERVLRRAAKVLPASSNEAFSVGREADEFWVLGLGYDMLYPAMTDAERKTIREALTEKLFPRYLRAFTESYGSKNWWINTYSNWTPWLSGGAGVAAMALIDEEPIAKDVLAKVRHAFKPFYTVLDQKPEDGGWDEGPMYWGHILSTGLTYHVALQRVLGTDDGFFGLPGVAITGQFVIDFTGPDGRLVAFNDCDFNPPSFVNPGLYYTAARYNKPEQLWYADFYKPNWWEQSFSLLWRPEGETPPPPPLRPIRLYRDVNWAVFRNKDLFVPFKGGDLGANHGQLDAGNFLVYAGTERLLKDPGYGKRETSQHNTLLVNGHGQSLRGAIRSGEPTAANAKIEYAACLGPDRYLVCDITSCYNQLLSRFRRHLILTDSNLVILFDEIQGGASTYSLNLQTHLKVEGNFKSTPEVAIKGQKAGAVISLLGEGEVKRSVSGGTITIETAGPQNCWRAFTIISASPNGLPPAINAEATFGADKASLKIDKETFTFSLSGGTHRFVPRGKDTTVLADMCPGEAKGCAAKPPETTTPPPVAIVDNKHKPEDKPAPAAISPEKPKTEDKPIPPVITEKLSTMEDWVAKLKSRLDLYLKSGQSPRFLCQALDARVSVESIGSNYQLNVTDRGGKKSVVEWEKLTLDDYINLSQDMAAVSNSSLDYALLAYFCHAAKKTDKAQEYLKKAGSYEKAVRDATGL